MALRIRRMRNGDIATDGLSVSGNHATLFARQGDIRSVKIDLSDYLGTGDTITAAEATAGRLSISTPVISAGVITAEIAGPNGWDYADITATLSTGERVTQRIHAMENTPRMTSRDYVS